MNLYGVNAWALSTYDGKKGLIDNYINPIIGKVKIKDVTPRFMDEYYRKLLKVQRVVRNNQSFEGETVSPRNVREIHKILNCAFNQAVRWELLETNPVSKATLPKCEKKVRDIWTMEDLSNALEVCEDDRLALAIHLAFSCSLRLGEIMGLMKAVQGDTGHAQLKMVSDVYSHILDEDRRHNAEKMERDFYKKAEDKPATEPKAKPTNAATEQLVNLLNASPELAAQLLQMLTANQTGQAATA